MATERERRFVGPRRGQLIFALGFVALSLLLLSQIGTQTIWANKTKFFAQPRFWPGVGLGGMVVLGGLHLYRLPWRRFTASDRAEVIRWAQVLEYTLWFLVYVLIVPVIGYLLSTLIFVPALTWRMGYRRPLILWASVVFALAVVVLFKTFLSVKIPGGLIYDYLPGALRSFFILYL
ncbi:tripartite tricarboxylate transporter TctB family protein [Pseudodonghicola flavimaris]|uniref:Tripartite tricarboxylate transporter TctB family protein n=1 Tax=Pseudodonghicola flavimaris TaxID=3050036 RepID=A0ABT7F2Z9_9RHOB|nr:tripartite tricarboxylate transporter TctB family protein [Pseudodonghicola flavimaris]MDK3018977.1 tripartite tricarboxylate transporter TctB family protein [Pseudodonghicola flavimaris]